MIVYKDRHCIRCGYATRVKHCGSPQCIWYVCYRCNKPVVFNSVSNTYFQKGT